MAVCDLRIAVNSRRKNAAGEWEDKPNFISVTVFGKSAENAARYLAKGRPVGIDGRIDHQEWETDGNKRERIVVIADNVQYLGGPADGSGGQAQSSSQGSVDFDAPVGPDTSRSAAADDDIPF